jgi:hypothetical protein
MGKLGNWESEPGSQATRRIIGSELEQQENCEIP